MKKIVALFFFTCLLTACTDKTVNNYYYTGKPGSLMGKVSVNTNFNKYDNYDLSGVEVLVLNTGQKTFTDTTGTWVIDSLYAGVYDIAFSREDCDTSVVFAYNYPGNGIGYFSTWINLVQKPKYNVMTDSIFSYINHDGKYNYSLYGRTDKSTRINYVLCLGRLENLSIENCTSYFNFGMKLGDSVDIMIALTSSKYLDEFSYDERIFVCLYAGNVYEDEDRRTGYIRYYGFGNISNVISFVYKEK